MKELLMMLQKYLKRVDHMEIIFKDNQFSYQALRMLSEATSEQSDICEVIATARKIKDGNYNSWFDEWSKLADRVRIYAEECLKEGHFLSAAHTFLRAANYYRMAGFFLLEDDENELREKLVHQSLDCFSYVIKYGEPKIESVEIPFENTTLPGHFYCADSSKRSPTIIAMTGYDGTKEEMYGLAVTALKHGMNCIAFEGPGQGEMIVNRGIPFRPDYENVVSVVIDFLEKNPSVDPNRIVLWGESFGGYLAPRAAAFEHRLAACIANGGIFDFMGFRRPENITREEFFQFAARNPDEYNRLSVEMMKQSSQIKWAIKHGMRVFHAKTPAEYLVKAESYYLDKVASNITCPTLIIDSEEEAFFQGQAKRLFEELNCPKEYKFFTIEEGASVHCQEGGKLLANDYILNWIEKVLGGGLRM